LLALALRTDVLDEAPRTKISTVAQESVISVTLSSCVPCESATHTGAPCKSVVQRACANASLAVALADGSVEAKIG